MSYKTKTTFYCDEPDCMANQTFVTSLERPDYVRLPRGDSQTVLAALRSVGWQMKRRWHGGVSSIDALCPEHAPYVGSSVTPMHRRVKGGPQA